MDKFFIQAAFKSLDDIEKDDNIKRSLKESREREASKRESAKKSLKEMYVDRYKYFKNKINTDFKDLVSVTQDKLNESKSKEEDFKILSKFWTTILNKATWNDEEWRELFLDSGARQPMPESVLKQISNMIFEIHNLDTLNDLDVYDGFDLDTELTEAINKRKEYLKTCAGNPDINVDAFNHATDIGGSSPTSGLGESFDDDELWDKYVGKQVTINPENEKYHDQVGEITDLITSGSSFEDSVWEIYLSQGERLELLGKELKLSPKTESIETEDDIELLESIVLDESVKDDLKTLDEIQKILMSQLSEDIKPTKNKFNLRDEEEVKAAQEKLNQKEDTKEKEFVIVHPLNIHKDAKSGDAILQCDNCKETYYLNKDELVSEQGELEQDKVYNLDYQCEHCGSNSGYVYVGDLATEDAKEAKELASENDIEQSSLETLDELPLEPVEEQEEPEEIVEESFDKLITTYGKKIYENLECYKTTSVTQEDRNKYIVEGTLTLINGKKHSTTFLIETLKTSKNKLLFKGSNKDLVESSSPFRFVASVKDKKLIFENMRYRYVEKVDNKDYLVEGLERNK